MTCQNLSRKELDAMPIRLIRSYQQTLADALGDFVLSSENLFQDDSSISEKLILTKEYFRTDVHIQSRVSKYLKIAHSVQKARKRLSQTISEAVLAYDEMNPVEKLSTGECPETMSLNHCFTMINHLSARRGDSDNLLDAWADICGIYKRFLVLYNIDKNDIGATVII